MRAWMVKLRRFFRRHGFMVLTLVCVLSIAGAAVYGRARILGFKTPAAVADQTEKEEVQAVNAPVLAETAAPSPTAAPLQWPVSGRKILRGHSDDPVWFEALGLFEVHSGLDIEAEAGEAVYAAADGVVTAYSEDPRYGYTLTLEGDDGLLIRYANLDGTGLAEVGSRVRSGQQIGAVGADAYSVQTLGSHLHFEAFRNGNPVALP